MKHVGRTLLRVLLVTTGCPLGAGVLIGRLIGVTDPRPLMLEGILPLIAIVTVGVIAGRTLRRQLPEARVYKLEMYRTVLELALRGHSPLLMFEDECFIKLTLGHVDGAAQIVRPEEWRTGSKDAVRHTVYVIEKDDVVSKWSVRVVVGLDPLPPLSKDCWSSEYITPDEVDRLLRVLKAHSRKRVRERV